MLSLYQCHDYNEHDKLLTGSSAMFLGVIILSAVLKRRMILADKAKGLFISKWVFYLFIHVSDHVLRFLDNNHSNC